MQENKRENPKEKEEDQDTRSPDEVLFDETVESGDLKPLKSKKEEDNWDIIHEQHKDS